MPDAPIVFQKPNERTRWLPLATLSGLFVLITAIVYRGDLCEAFTDPDELKLALAILGGYGWAQLETWRERRLAQGNGK